MEDKSTLLSYRTHKADIGMEPLYDNSGGSALLFEPRAGALRTLGYRRKFDTLAVVARAICRICGTPPGSRTTSPVLVHTPVHRASRRIRGLPPEAEADVTVRTTSSGMTSTSVQTTPSGTESTMVNRYTLESPQVPTPFHGTVLEDVEDCLVDFERVAALNATWLIT
ncbi:hypothetical protein HPB52_022843 [Rhipicephalus sanguineus]|uniref:Uncharacterized protein n=1 Tax=Rhipicephalus sanguineus TaxID=34632 RepID=A0A9D4PSX4_RHISA|nr:hypothetical protein HPB52_022843 [Rhipicephalus sanguineus]